eukprot:TRINITY_DN11420_c0_g1_i1.p1 TRINITY_DN11420_c0_g1~~TRINITY_DN11420_c0_g1_i1.p1  ORF type:complete len:444 (+),score=94.89 TRINITY_DN11420_c0_g1_i1:121-1452(+)
MTTKKQRTSFVGAAVIGQSGGPTAVINQSLVGFVLELAKAEHRGEVTRVLGMRHGLKGLLTEDLIDLGKETPETLEAVARTPAAALGSVRMKPTPADVASMIPIFKKFDVRFFFYIGGNDSAHAAHIVSEESKKQGYIMRCFHIPKTVDNDLCVTDHSPGYASAARFVAHAFQGDDRDLRAMGGVKINIVMGRDAGWLTAASTLGRRQDMPGHTKPKQRDGPHLVYCPEAVFEEERFLEDIARVMAELGGRCLVAVSEGIRDADGVLFATKLSPAALEGDSHGNITLGGSGALGDALAAMVKKRFCCRVRADTLGYVQRGFPADISSVDADEARESGAFAARVALSSADDSGSVAIRRSSKAGNNDAYSSECFLTPLATVAKQTKPLPTEWLVSSTDAKKGSGSGKTCMFSCDVGPEFGEYARGFVGNIEPMADLLGERACPL